MELNHVKEFIALTKTENYLEAAENLFISQSSLSKHIKSLEAELGTTLFDRTTRQVKLNEAGKVFLKYAQRLIDVQHQCHTALINLKEAEEQSLIIGTIPLMASYGITDMLIDFKKANVKINLSIIEGETEQLKQKLRNDDCDLIFIRRLSGQKEVIEDLDDFAVIPFTTDHLVAVLPNEHPLANQALIDLSELKNEEFLFLPPHSVMYNISLQACRQAGFTPSIAYTGKRAENIIDLVSKGMGISLLMAKPISYINTRNLVKLVPVLPHIETEIVIYYKKSALLSKAASHFLEFVQR
ncbi:LysR family transcriptional regulator [Streptococcus gallolyticus]|uniref:LysR family transcriptional regulator n=1 Tax=Streptococcus gallolyticus TaxID=315405 RepID=A0A368UCJ7_9STRE|nr:LysR family transcriptional regulator [Streptococcus gallolyticus]RCW16634.1 LysR family transcriptional regulator [Streptococcus gallolyticus]